MLRSMFRTWMAAVVAAARLSHYLEVEPLLTAAEAAALRGDAPSGSDFGDVAAATAVAQCSSRIR